MSLLTTLLLAFAPSAIAARRRDDEIEKLREENKSLRNEREALERELQRARSDISFLRETLNQTILQDLVARQNRAQAAMAQAGMLAQLQAQQAPMHPLVQHQLYNHQHAMLGLQQSNWQNEDYCNCVPDRAELFRGA